MKRKLESNPVEIFFQLCTRKDVENAHKWWDEYGAEHWNGVSDTAKRNCAHCSIRSDDLSLVKRVYEEAPDIFLDLSEYDYCSVLHEAIIQGVSLDIVKFLCDTCHWKDITEDGDALGRPAITTAIHRFAPLGDERLLLLIDYYGTHAPHAFTKNPVNTFASTPWETAEDLLNHDSECYQRMHSIVAQSPMSPKKIEDTPSLQSDGE